MDNDLLFVDKVVYFLKIGVVIFGFDNVIVSKVINDNYVIMYVLIFDNSIVVGIVFSFIDIYCVDIINVGEIVVYVNIDVYLGVLYFCYDKFKFCCYIVFFIYVNNKCYGIFNFFFE